MSLNRISCRNCKLCLLPGVKCIHLRREHKDFGDRIHVGNERVTGVKGAWVTEWGISRDEKLKEKQKISIFDLFS